MELASSPDQSLAQTQRRLGYMFYTGQGVPQDYSQALHWFLLAAHQGDAVAQINIGHMYEKGQGVSQDYVQAQKWYSLPSQSSPSH